MYYSLDALHTNIYKEKNEASNSRLYVNTRNRKLWAFLGSCPDFPRD